MSSFSDFSLPSPIQSALAKMHYTAPTPIQQQAIPIILAQNDLIGIAQTGTGKTAAFSIPLLTNLLNSPGSQALILVPTRELAIQIETVLKQLTTHLPFVKLAVVIGGASHFMQKRALDNKPHIIIATPGRLHDHLNDNKGLLRNINAVVLDEADRMLDIGFEPQIRRILDLVTNKRQTLLFSATFPAHIEKLTKRYMIDPKRVAIGAVSKPIEKINQIFVKTTAQDKNRVLVQQLEARSGSVLIFTRTKHRTDRLTRFLSQEGFEVDRIHGDRTQGQRNRVIDGFRNQKFRILVATDIAARGLDVPHIAHVINYDLPQVAEDYVHRIGRTARAGSKGEALCLLTPEETKQWQNLNRHLSTLNQTTHISS